MRIIESKLELIPEPIKAAFGFKGKSSAKPMWNTAVRIWSTSGKSAMGLSNQGILWSDAAVYERFSHGGGNSMMYLMSNFALKLAKEIEFERPDQLLKQLIPEVWAYGNRVAGMQIRETFVLNALVALDTAAWLLYARENGLESFDQIIPEHARAALDTKNDCVAAIPLITYSASVNDILKEVQDGRFFMKIKIGSDPEHDGDREKMLRWDIGRIQTIHNALKDIPCEHTLHGHIPYYLDANGRYDTKDRLMRLLDAADHIGALERIVLLEEPFPEDKEYDLTNIPVRLAADESAHSDRDVRKRIDMGYRAIALKPIAKTMSMTFDMLCAAKERNIPGFCADLTVNAWMVDLNKNFAARLPALPTLRVGVLESNGHQYYSRWEEQIQSLADPEATWVRPKDGLYILDESFYRMSGGFFGESSLYASAFSA